MQLFLLKEQDHILMRSTSDGRARGYFYETIAIKNMEKIELLQEVYFPHSNCCDDRKTDTPQ